MKIQIFSDLHLESSDIILKIKRDTDVVVLAGDIVNGYQIIATDRLQKLINKIKVPVVYIAGNHEFYNSRLISVQQIRELLSRMKEDCPNFNYLENDSIVIKGVRFVGGTLWSNFDLADDLYVAMAKIGKMIGDFRHCFCQRSGHFAANVLDPNDIRNWNRETRIRFEEELKKPFDGKTVVVTHFCPSPRSIHEKYQDDPCNPYFCCNCEDLMKLGVDLWIHGHTHSSFDYQVGNTRVVCNPRGYNTENAQYNGKCVVEI